MINSMGNILLDRLLSAKGYKEIDFVEARILLNSSDNLVRCDTIEFLANFIENKNVQDLIIEMLQDPDYLVRCEACEALQGLQQFQIVELFFKYLEKENNSTVRMYMVSALCSILKKIPAQNKKTLLQRINKLYSAETDKRVQWAYLSVTYILNHDVKCVQDILKHINDNDYHNRCIIINLLYDIIDKNILDLVLKSYREQYELETTRAVKELLKENIDYFSNN